MTIDERIKALLVAVENDGENIRELLRIAEIHDRRIKNPEDDTAEPN